ncbi:hypothetical protein [uncultured Flavobacterium sp.]|uniref:hypothetical protein n=1 Tax=uncultured Flavobacterium sp. TaxID=165435 RepID=UPI0025FECA63|nr:hypothetical protein [uncultured Flavobacterium sp.]
MDDIALFYLLKEKILVKYREHYPYHTGTVHAFGNKDIGQLIDAVDRDCNERISEKWVYTHLKPLENEKLPRKDMLDIFCKWTGHGNWDEFVFRHKRETDPVQETEKPLTQKRNNKIMYMVMGIAVVIFAAAIALTALGSDVTICLRDRYTQKEIEEGKASLYVLEEGKKHKLQRNGSCYILKEPAAESLIIAESPYYKADTLKITTGRTHQYEFDLQPDDYAMMMRAYMNKDTGDWKKRKSQLNDIISDDAVIEEIMFDDIGVEFLNKEEFINKITTPSKISKAMEIVEIEYKEKKIVSLKYMQKEK